ncbi:MAG: substrate-binding domain-containing protein [Alistipes sp.]|nr:substrate-binding domain-containing protein [Alistipes sp.]
MARKIRIKDIAQLAGVSPGTVDRVLHNRGNVSPAARSAIDAVLKQVGYHPNMHLSGISLRRHYKIVVAIPEFRKGEYWENTYKGIMRAVHVYENIRIECKFMYYNQFDLYACRATFEQITSQSPDGVIIGPTFRDETVYLTTLLEEHDIPYVYVDSTIDCTFPLTYFASDPYACGYLMGKLIDAITPADAEYVLFQSVRVGDASANTTILRKQGFMGYMTEHDRTKQLHRLSFSVVEPERNSELIGDFFERNPRVRGAVVLSSRSSVIASYLHEHRIDGVRLIGVDLTENNSREIRNGHIDFVLGQRPEQQGYMAIKSLIQYLIYGSKVKSANIMPLDIITRENLDLYSEFSEVAYVDAK